MAKMRPKKGQNNKKPKNKGFKVTGKKGNNRKINKNKGQDVIEKKRTNIVSSTKGLSMIEKCKLQMSASLLRMTDERLYTNEAKDANMDEKDFISYHQAYETVASKWPIKPIDFILSYLERKKSFGKLSELIFADVGCGRLPSLKLGLPEGTTVHSFDLVSAHPDIKECNMEKLSIENESIDCCVYSLSLMATNLGKVLLEAKRALKLNASLLVVEVTSRFERKEKRWTNQMLKIGFKLKFSEPIPPNGYFTFFHFLKIDPELNYRKQDTRIQLKPCQYKAR